MKSTGTAPYAYDRHDVVANQAYGCVVGSTRRQRTHRLDGPHGLQGSARLLGGPEILHCHQEIASSWP
jgi:xanthine dehydrogenase YagR molybdenum-binding subunit